MMFEVKIVTHRRLYKDIEKTETKLSDLLNNGWEIKGHGAGTGTYSDILSFVLVRNVNESKEDQK